MKHRRGFKHLLMVLGIIACFMAGYSTVSVVDSCPAKALVCCSSMCITLLGNNISTNLAEIYALTFAPGMLIAKEDIELYYAIQMLSFKAKVMFKIGQIVANWLSYWDTFWDYNLYPALQGMTEQILAVDNAQAQALGMFQDAANRNREILKKQIAQIEAARAHRAGENACVGGTMAGGMSQAMTFQQAYEASAPAALLARSGNSLTNPSSQRSRGGDTASRFYRYLDRYKMKGENAKPGAGYSAFSNDPAFGGGPDADANGSVSGLGGDPGGDVDVTGQIFAKDTIDVTDPATKATVDDLITNIAEPFIQDPIPKTSMTGGGAEGQEAFLQRQSYMSKRQAVYEALYSLVARRTPGTGLGDFVHAMRGAVNVPATEFSANPSRGEVMEVMMSERFRSGRYMSDQMGPPGKAAREAVIQSAYQVMQMSDQLDLLDRYSVLLAAQASDDVRANTPTVAPYALAPLD